MSWRGQDSNRFSHFRRQIYSLTTSVHDRLAPHSARVKVPQYGPSLLRKLFSLACQPLGSPDTPGAFLFGLRLRALDSTIEVVADTPANAKAFGRYNGPRDASAYPQIKCIYLEVPGENPYTACVAALTSLRV
jgi:hypothetical protein